MLLSQVRGHGTRNGSSDLGNESLNQASDDWLCLQNMPLILLLLTTSTCGLSLFPLLSFQVHNLLKCIDLLKCISVWHWLSKMHFCVSHSCAYNHSEVCFFSCDQRQAQCFIIAYPSSLSKSIFPLSILKMYIFLFLLWMFSSFSLKTQLYTTLTCIVHIFMLSLKL